MCVVSMIMDHYGEKWGPYVQPPYKWPPLTQPTMPTETIRYVPVPTPMISPEELAEFKRLLERAREYDRRNNEPDCELESKKQKILELAKELGIDVSFVNQT